MAVSVVSLRTVSALWSNSIRCFHLSTLLSQLKFLKRPICITADYNPLLDQNKLPRFHLFETNHVVPGVGSLTEDFERKFSELEDKLSSKYI